MLVVVAAAESVAAAAAAVVDDFEKRRASEYALKEPKKDKLQRLHQNLASAQPFGLLGLLTERRR